jgi:hypothetical protein
MNNLNGYYNYYFKIIIFIYTIILTKFMKTEDFLSNINQL